MAHVAGALWLSHRPEEAPEVREPEVLTVSLLAAARSEPVVPQPERSTPAQPPRLAESTSRQQPPRPVLPALPAAAATPLLTAAPSAAPAVAPATVTPAAQAMSIAPPAATAQAVTPAANAEPVRPPPPPKVLAASAVRYLVEPVLTYPRASRDLGESGTVVLKVLVDEQGRPKEIEVAKSSGHARLDQQALQAMRRARFQPHIEDGAARPVWVMAPQTFTLEDQ